MKWKYYSLISLVIALFIFIGIQNKIETNDLKSHGIIVNVRIMEFISGKSGYGSYTCEFFYKGVKKDLISSSNITNHFTYYIGEMFPAIYSEKYEVLRILMIGKDFEEFGLKFPDSLLNRPYPFPH
jgi:hypothetical protein